MTRDELRAAGARLFQWHERFAPLFGRREAREHSFVYLRGLLSDQKRKSVEPIALRFAKGRNGAPVTQNEVVAMQEFLTASPWEAGDVFRELQAVFAEELVPTTSQWSIGTVGVIDESGFTKAGNESVGVARQWCGRVGKTENCQVGVFLVGVTPGGTALLDGRLFLTEERCADSAHRTKTRVPEDVAFKSKPMIAADMIERTTAAGKVRFDWIIGDELYGDSGPLLTKLETMRQRYLLETKKTTLFWTVDPATLGGATPGPKLRKKIGSYRYKEVKQVQEIARELPPEAWHVLQLREGAKGPLAYEFAMVRGWAMRDKRPGPPIWLLMRRTLEENPQVWYYVSNADETTPLEQMAMVTGTRCRVEEFFQDGKTYLGMADYEARSWRSWHHHMSLVALAHLYVTLTRRDMRRDVPELTLDMAIRVLQSAFAHSELTEDESIDLIDYHLHRNRVAHDSHRKSWLRKHKRCKPEVLL